MTARSLRPWSTRIALFGAILAGVHLALYQGAGPLDDDFISYRYARNLANGLGLVFQEGERIEGFTNPLWVLIHAAGLLLGMVPEKLTPWLGLASVVGCLMAASAVERVVSRAAGGNRVVPHLALYGIALCPALAFHAMAGLGTALLGALILGWFAAWLAAEEKGASLWLAGLLLVLACLLRQEAALIAFPFAFANWRRPAAWLPIAALAGWTGFRLAYYGEWLPNTYYAKRLPLVDDLAFGWRYLLESTVVAGVGVFVVLALLAPLYQSRGRVRRAMAVAAAGLALHTAYVVAAGGDYLALARFFVPTLPLALTLSAVWMGRRLGTGLVYAGLTAALLWTHMASLAPERYVVHTRAYLHVLHDFQESRWASLGRYFRANTPPESGICLSPIGAFSWESERRIVDVLGLTNRDLVGVEPNLSIPMKGHQRYDAESVLRAKPDYVILGNGVRDPRTGRVVVSPWERDLFLDPRFQEDYTHHVVPIPGGEDLDVWLTEGADPLPGMRHADVHR